MIGEALLAIKALDSAYSLVKNSIDRGKEVSDMAGEISKFMNAKANVEKEIKKAHAEGKSDLLEGSALEEAITLDAQEQRMERMMAKIAEHYRVKGQTHRWGKIKQNAAKIQAQRDKDAQARLKAAGEQDALVKDIFTVLAVVMVGMLVAGIVLYLVINAGAE